MSFAIICVRGIFYALVYKEMLVSHMSKGFNVWHVFYELEGTRTLRR